MNRSDILYSSIEIRNTHPSVMTAYLSSPAAPSQRLAVLNIPPAQVATINAPVGEYQLNVDFYGTHWCGDAKGYSDGNHVRITSLFPNLAGKTGKIDITPKFGDPAPAFTYTHESPPPPPPIFRVSGGRYIDLASDRGGHYHIDGSMLGIPLRMMLDTGATTTSVSNDFALRARIPSCRPGSTNTANGISSSCQARIPELIVGPFRIQNIDVNILPRLDGDALLGMNVLRHFSIEQSNGMLRLSAP